MASTGQEGQTSTIPDAARSGQVAALRSCGEKVEGSWIEEETWLASKAPWRQTVPRAEIWAVLMVLVVWDWAYDPTVITDASYTVRGMEDLARRKNTRGPNRDIWALVYAEMD